MNASIADERIAASATNPVGANVGVGGVTPIDLRQHRQAPVFQWQVDSFPTPPVRFAQSNRYLQGLSTKFTRTMWLRALSQIPDDTLNGCLL